MIKVKSTREGLVGGKTASGYVIDTVVPFVALPSTKALGMFVKVTNPLNGHSCLAIVLDVGPWNEHDMDYVFQAATAPASGLRDGSSVIRPAAEDGTDTRGRVTNHAAIDLSEKVWKLLGMTDNTEVWWEFVG